MKKIPVKELRIISIILGFAATVMIVFPALTAGGTDNTYTGLQVVFGHEFVSLGDFGSGQIRFSFLNMLAYLLPLGAALVLLFYKAASLIATIMFAVATILLFLVTEFTVVAVTVFGNVNVVDVEWSYAIGLIFAAVLTALAFVIGAFRIYKKV